MHPPVPGGVKAVDRSRRRDTLWSGLAKGYVMSDILPEEVREGLRHAPHGRRKRRSTRWVKSGDRTFAILRHWDGGFAIDTREDAPLRGLVDLYEGGTHLCQALIFTSHEEPGERIFEVKYANRVSETAPIPDFVRED